MTQTDRHNKTSEVTLSNIGILNFETATLETSGSSANRLDELLKRSNPKAALRSTDGIAVTALTFFDKELKSPVLPKSSSETKLDFINTCSICLNDFYKNSKELEPPSKLRELGITAFRKISQALCGPPIDVPLKGSLPNDFYLNSPPVIITVSYKDTSENKCVPELLAFQLLDIQKTDPKALGSILEKALACEAFPLLEKAQKRVFETLGDLRSGFLQTDFHKITLQNAEEALQLFKEYANSHEGNFKYVIKMASLAVARFKIE